MNRSSEILEEAVSVAASFACAVLTQESLLDLLFVGAESYCFTAGRGLAHADQMLEILASVANCADKNFATLEQLVLNHVSVVSGCICVFQKWDDARKRIIKKLRTLGVPVLVLVVVGRANRNRTPGRCATRRTIFTSWKLEKSRNNWRDYNDRRRSNSNFQMCALKENAAASVGRGAAVLGLAIWIAAHWRGHGNHP
jgi:hypothetical protein